MSSSADDPCLLLHHSHEHGLVLREFSENITRFTCSICLSSVKGGLAYHCKDCNYFFLHKSCVGLPFTIQHPFHPQHPLELQCTEADFETQNCSGCTRLTYRYQYGYRCDNCRVALHVGCAAATLPATRMKEPDDEHDDKAKKEETIQHIAHEHPLEKFNVNSPYSTICTGCRHEISGGVVYGCCACIFVLHESCALSPPQIESHPLHPQHPLALVVDLESNAECRACGDGYTGFGYYCCKCDFNLDLRCAVSVGNPVPQDNHDIEKDRQEIQHFSHPHPLRHCHAKRDIGLECDFCRMNITGSFYFCGHCSFFKLHKSCVELPREMVHPLHPDHLLICQTDSGDCSLCDLAYLNKFLFKCQECHFGLHPQCALQSFSASEEELAINILQIHTHPLKLQIGYDSYKRCYICSYPGNGSLAYDCEAKDYSDETVRDCMSFMIHKTCAELPRESVYSVHPRHPLILLPEPPKDSNHCSACHRGCYGYTLACDSCKVLFHLHCGLMKPTLKYQRHEHGLIYFEEIDSPRQYDMLCNVCGDNCRIDIYRCTPCNYNVHFGCLSLPQSIKHEWHIHPMELRDKYINEDFDFDEQYCDLCETVRNPEHGVYYCIECRCATHIDCVIPELVLDVDKRRRMDDLELRKLDEQIFSFEAEAETARKELEAAREKLERLTKAIAELKGKKQEILSPMLQLEEE